VRYPAIATSDSTVKLDIFDVWSRLMRSAVLILAMLEISSCQETKCYQKPVFTDLLGQKLSPDGEVKAAYVVQDYGFGGPTTFGITLSGKTSDPLNADPILTEGEDIREIKYERKSTNTLQIQLPCGWWGHLTNHYQVMGTSRVIDIIYTSPPEDCKGRTSTSSSSVSQ
jgi:hypothetical protein